MAHQHNPSSAEEQSTRKTILIVEDDAAIGNFLMEAIAQETHYHSLLVPDGFQALKTLKGIKPDLLLLDYYLPQMNGIELYDQLHTLPEYTDIPVILLTTNLEKRRPEIVERNIVGLDKPLELDDLLHAIEEVLA
jgi:CheY-like chemotaxis protein